MRAMRALAILGPVCLLVISAIAQEPACIAAQSGAAQNVEVAQDDSTITRSSGRGIQSYKWRTAYISPVYWIALKDEGPYKNGAELEYTVRICNPSDEVIRLPWSATPPDPTNEELGSFRKLDSAVTFTDEHGASTTVTLFSLYGVPGREDTFITVQPRYWVELKGRMKLEAQAEWSKLGSKPTDPSRQNPVRVTMSFGVSIGDVNLDKKSGKRIYSAVPLGQSVPYSRELGIYK